MRNIGYDLGAPREQRTKSMRASDAFVAKKGEKEKKSGTTLRSVYSVATRLCFKWKRNPVLLAR